MEVSPFAVASLDAHIKPRKATQLASHPMPRSSLLGAALYAAACLLLGSGPASALGPVAVPETWGGPLGTRERLTGDWGGSRDELARKGIVLDLDLLATPQVVMSGGRDTGATVWGNAIYTLNIDTGKAGWWQGGFINLRGDSGFGNDGYGDVGAVVPTNAATLLPDPLDEGSGLESATFTQFLSPRFGLTMGKIYTLELTHAEFHGNFQTQFMNTALAVPMASALIPIAAFGGGAVFLPTPAITVMALALDSNGTVMDNDIGDAFEGGVSLIGAVNVKVAPWGLPGHQSLTGMWSDKTRLSLEQDPSNIASALLTERFPRLGDPGRLLTRIIEDRFPQLLVPVRPANREDETWMISYGFDQYLWQPDGDPERGVGLFFNFGATDGNPNPVEYSYQLGLGGKGVVPMRPRDTFGVAWARTQFSDDFVPFLRDRLALGLEEEDAVELFYNAAITHWLSVSPSIQIVDAGLERALDGNRRLAGTDTAAVFYLRTYVRF